jgi:hypothetical protein
VGNVSTHVVCDMFIVRRASCPLGALAQTQAIQAQINGLELQLIDLRNKRDQRLTGIWETVKRVRATVKGATAMTHPSTS